MIERGFYIIKDEFFSDFPDPYLKSNKGKHRPHYFAIRDPKTGLYWMIPMSSRAEKYSAIINRRESFGKSCDTLHICKLDNGIMNVFLIQDMFPITENYIAAPYTINSQHLILTSDAEADVVYKKAKRVLNMLHRGVRFMTTQPDVLRIESALLTNKPNA